MEFGKRCDGLLLEGVGAGIEDWIWSAYTANIHEIFKKLKNKRTIVLYNTNNMNKSQEILLIDNWNNVE